MDAHVRVRSVVLVKSSPAVVESHPTKNRTAVVLQHVHLRNQRQQQVERPFVRSDQTNPRRLLLSVPCDKVS